jgi:hypothetical protein
MLILGRLIDASNLAALDKIQMNDQSVLSITIRAPVDKNFEPLFPFVEQKYKRDEQLLDLSSLASYPELSQIRVDFNDDHFANALVTAIRVKARQTRTLVLANNNIVSLKNYREIFQQCHIYLWQIIKLLLSVNLTIFGHPP